MPLTADDFERIVRKLHMAPRNNNHRFVWFEHEGKKVTWTERSHGRGDIGRVEFAIRKQLKVSGKQMKDLAECPMTRDAYIAHLRAIGVIAAPESN